MFRKMTLWVSAIALMLVTTQAQAAVGEWMINLNGGIASPTGDYKNLAKLGFMGGVGFDYGLSENLALGIDGSFISNSASDDFEAESQLPTGSTASFEMLNGGAHLKYMFPMASESSIAPYVVGGLGIYNVKTKFETSSTSPAYDDLSDSKFGARGGLGLMYKTSEKVGIGIEGTFNWIDTDAFSTQFIGVQAGVTIGMGTPSAP